MLGLSLLLHRIIRSVARAPPYSKVLGILLSVWQPHCCQTGSELNSSEFNLGRDLWTEYSNRSTLWKVYDCFGAQECRMCCWEGGTWITITCFSWDFARPPGSCSSLHTDVTPDDDEISMNRDNSGWARTLTTRKKQLAPTSLLLGLYWGRWDIYVLPVLCFAARIPSCKTRHAWFV